MGPITPIKGTRRVLVPSYNWHHGLILRTNQPSCSMEAGQLPSQAIDLLDKLQCKMLYQVFQSDMSDLYHVFQSDMSDPLHNVVFNSALKDGIVVKSRHRGRKCPYWLETTPQRMYPVSRSEHSRRGTLGRFTVYSDIHRDLRNTGQAPLRA